MAEVSCLFVGALWFLPPGKYDITSLLPNDRNVFAGIRATTKGTYEGMPDVAGSDIQIRAGGITNVSVACSAPERPFDINTSYDDECPKCVLRATVDLALGYDEQIISGHYERDGARSAPSTLAEFVAKYGQLMPQIHGDEK